MPGNRSRQDRRDIIHPEASEDNEVGEKDIFSARYVAGPKQRRYSTIDDFGEASYGNFALLHEHKSISPKKLAGPPRRRRAGGAGRDAKRGCNVGLQGSVGFDTSFPLCVIEVLVVRPPIVEIVDPIRRIDNKEGHESDEDGHKKMSDEGHSPLVVRNGKYPEHSIVSFNET